MNITPLRYTYTCLGAVALCDNLQDSKLRPLIKTHLFANSALSVLQKVTPVKMKVVKTKIILKHTFSLSPCAKKGPEKFKPPFSKDMLEPKTQTKYSCSRFCSSPPPSPLPLLGLPPPVRSAMPRLPDSWLEIYHFRLLTFHLLTFIS